MNLIFVKTQFEGLHNYPDAPEEVSFLRNTHRHIFYVKVSIQVFYNDRDIEFILFKRYVESILKERNLSYKSCEMISDDIYVEVTRKYPNRSIIIEISEDNENGSIKEYLIKE